MGKAMSNLLIDKSEIQHLLVQHRQIIIHMLLLNLLHGKSSHSPAILFINLRTFVLGGDDIVV